MDKGWHSISQGRTCPALLANTTNGCNASKQKKDTSYDELSGVKYVHQCIHKQSGYLHKKIKGIKTRKYKCIHL